MAKNIQRPRYYEGQILGAADLQLALDHARGQLARHQRSLHSWGIAQGLELSQTSPEEIEITAGIAVDGTGREIIVPEAVVLDTTDFRDSNVAIDQPDVYYPIFLLGRDQASVAQLQFAGTCSSSESNRIIEGYEFKFGSPGTELEQDENAPDVDAGPGVASEGGEWRILIGFVKWDNANKQFTETKSAYLEQKRRYVGVRAEEVLTPSGQMTIRTASFSEAGKPTLRIEKNNEGQGELSFGLSDAKGGISKVFSVNEKGDVVAKGTLQGALTEGVVLVESGIATDGIIIPLPPEVDEDQVANGQVRVHAHVTPRIPGSLPPDGDEESWCFFPHRCFVDEQRRVHCVFRWRNFVDNTDEYHSGACDYSLMAVVPSQEGGTNE